MTAHAPLLICLNAHCQLASHADNGNLGMWRTSWHHNNLAMAVCSVGAVQRAGLFNIIFELSSASSAPVIKEYLGKRAGTSDEVVLLKALVWTKMDYAEKAHDIHQGKKLIYTEFRMLSLLHGMLGIYRK